MRVAKITGRTAFVTRTEKSRYPYRKKSMIQLSRRQLLALPSAFAVACALAGAPQSSHAQAGIAAPARSDYAGVAERLERVIDREMRAQGLPALSIALVDDQEVVWARGFGVARPLDGTPATAATVYRVGSVSKLFTDVAVMQLVARNVLAPLGMTQSGFEPSAELGRGLAVASMWTMDGRSFPAPTFALGMSPAGSMYTTVTDLGRFLSALFAGGRGPHGRILEPQTIAHMWTPQFARADEQTGYGIGFRLGRLDFHRSIGHDGAIYGFATTLQALPDEKLGAVVVTTLDGANAAVDRIAES